jgi:hypothetical protein
MKIVRRQKFRPTLFYPLLFLKAAALRAMPVSATVVSIMKTSTGFIIAAVQMIALGGCATCF